MPLPMRLLALGLALVLALPGIAQEAAPDPTPLAGSWEGALEPMKGVKLRLVLHVKVAEGKATATLDSIDQAAKGLAVDAIALGEKRVVTFSMKRLAASYQGTLSADGKTIDGTFTQMKRPLPLRFRKTAKPSSLERTQTPKPPFPYRAEEVTFAPRPAKDEEGVTLAGTLTLPKGEGPFPAAILVSGSGPQDRDETLLGHKPFLVLADHLSRRGFAVLRYDDRGTARSTGDHSAATSADLARDAAGALHFLRARADIDRARIGIIGHSEGGLIAPMVATSTEGVAFIVLLAGPGVGGQAILHHQTRLILAAAGTPKAKIDTQIALQKQLYDVLRDERLDDTAKRALMTAKLTAFLRAQPAAELGGMTVEQAAAQQLQVLFSPWMRYFLTYDPKATLEKVRCPTLALFGSLDLQVDPAQSAGPLTTALATGACKDYSVITLPGLNHLFQRAKTGSPSEYAGITHTIDERALRTLTDWLDLRFARPKR